MGMTEVIERFAEKLGIERSEVDELLAGEEQPKEVDLDQELPGQAEAVLEVFLADSGGKPVEQDGLLWSPMIRAGTFALRPGSKGEKIKRPLKVVSGHSSDSLKELGLADLKDAFEDDAVDSVTVPETHENKATENTGYVEGMKILDLPVATGPHKGKKMPHLVGGYNFTEPEVKKRAQNGSIPGRSCGILYNYENTETASSYPAVVEHVALTPKPWIRGMQRFGRKLAFSQNEPEAMVFSDEAPASEETINDGDQIVAALSEQLADGETSVTWTHEDSPNWLREQVNQILREAREKKRKSQTKGLYVEDPTPYYRAQEAKSESPDGSGRALICDGYGDGANHWVASFKVEDGTVELDDFSSWQAVKSVYISDDRDPPEPANQPLSEDEPHETTPRERLQLAQAKRSGRVDRLPQHLQELAGVATESQSGLGEENNNQGGDPRMAVENSGGGTLELSEEAKAQIKSLEDKLAEEKRKNENLGEKVEKLSGSAHDADVLGFISELKALGFDEEHGFGGFLSEIQAVCLADDGGPAVMSEKFSEGGDVETELTLTEAFQRVFGTLEALKEGKIKLGEQLEQPASTESEDDDEEDGKPPKEDKEDELSAQEKADNLLSENPDLAREAGIPLSEPKPEEKKEEVV